MKNPGDVLTTMRQAALALCVLLAPALSSASKPIEDSGQIFLMDPVDSSHKNYLSNLPNGQRLEQAYRSGILMTDNQDSPLYLTHIAHRQGRLVQPGDAGGEDKLIYRWAVVEATDREGNQIFFMGEHNPPQAARYWVLEGTGKYDGIRGSGNMGWEPGKRYSDGPDGSVVMNYEFSFHYDKNDPNRKLPVHGKNVPDEVMEREWDRLAFVLRTSNDLESELPNGNLYQFSDEEGFVFTEDKDHPLYGIHGQGPVTVVLGPEQLARMERGELTLEDCCQYEIGMIALTDTDGDMMFVVIEARPGVGVSIDTLKGTGKFENAVFYGKASVADHTFFTRKDHRAGARQEMFPDTQGRAWPYEIGFDPNWFYFNINGLEKD